MRCGTRETSEGSGTRNEGLPGSPERKTHCATFCASPVAQLAGSDRNASCDGLQWMERVADCNKVREDVAWLRMESGCFAANLFS